MDLMRVRTAHRALNPTAQGSNPWGFTIGKRGGSTRSPLVEALSADRLGFDHGKHQELLAENTMFTGRHLVIPKLTDEK